ncbi:MAG: carboxypeptidase M32 [Acetobacteraceae bacterium]
MSEAHHRVAQRFRRLLVLGEAEGLLWWDAAAMMPPGGGPARADQLAVLAGLAHDMLTAPELAAELAEAGEEAGADAESDPWRAANIGLMQHAVQRAAALPGALVEAAVKANSACEKAWRKARERADYAALLPEFNEVVRLAREKARLLGEALSLDPYDALMDGYQRGIKATDVQPVFARYERFLTRALPQAEARVARAPAPLRPAGPFPEAAQEALCRRLIERVGVPFTHARLDRSLHPFCGGSPTDIRITTRYDEKDALRAIFAVLHESGHALYERGLPPAWARQPVGGAAGMAVHESQSLIIEMQACRSDAFLGWLGAELATAFGRDPAFAGDNLGRLCRRVERGFIRVDADELTYPAHVILRFRLERALIAGDLRPGDLPAAWREGIAALLGIVPPDDGVGCLQDIHWYDGSFGYFPSYSLGAMAAAQLMETARQAVPGLETALGAGDLSLLTGWLAREVHAKGSVFDYNGLLREATGRPLDPAGFEAHLTRRYLA